jgi:hypothetical protein
MLWQSEATDAIRHSIRASWSKLGQSEECATCHGVRSSDVLSVGPLSRAGQWSETRAYVESLKPFSVLVIVPGCNLRMFLMSIRSSRFSLSLFHNSQHAAMAAGKSPLPTWRSDDFSSTFQPAWASLRGPSTFQPAWVSLRGLGGCGASWWPTATILGATPLTSMGRR